MTRYLLLACGATRWLLVLMSRDMKNKGGGRGVEERGGEGGGIKV